MGEAITGKLPVGYNATAVANFLHTNGTIVGGRVFGRVSFSSDGAAWKNAAGDNCLDSSREYNGTNAYDSIANHVDFNLSSVTCCAWIRWHVPSTDSESIGGMRDDTNTQHAWLLVVDQTAGGLNQIGMSLSGDGGTTNFETYHSQNHPSIDANAWVHVAGSWNHVTQRCKLYIDGKPVDHTRSSSGTGVGGALHFSNREFRIGGAEDVAGHPNPTKEFNGDIAEFRLYGSALTDAQVADIAHNNGDPGSSVLKFEGSNLTDSSLNGHTRTATNSTANSGFPDSPPLGDNMILDNTMLSLKGVDDLVTIADHADFSRGDGATTDQAMSWGYWAKTPDWSASGRPVCKFTAAAPEWISFNASSIFRARLYDANTSNYIGRRTAALTPPGSPDMAGALRHWVVTYDGSRTSAGVKLYMDGVQVDTLDDKTGSYSAMHPTATPVTLGGDGTTYEDIDIQQFAFFHAELSAAQVLAWTNSGVPPTANRKCYLDFSDGSGTTITDVDGNHNGTVSGSTYAWETDDYRVPTGAAVQQTIDISALSLTTDTYCRFRFQSYANTTSASLTEFTIDFTGTGTIPGAPISLDVTASGASIVVTWIDTTASGIATDEDNFELYRSTIGTGNPTTNPTVWTLLASPANGVISYIDSAVVAGIIYYYIVRAKKSSAFSGWSSVDNAATTAGVRPTTTKNFATDAAIAVDLVDTLNAAMACASLTSVLNGPSSNTVTSSIISISGTASYTDGGEDQFILILTDGVVTDIFGDQAMCDVLASSFAGDFVTMLDGATGGSFTGVGATPSSKTVNGFTGRYYGYITYSDGTSGTFGSVFDGFVHIAV